ncbi:serine/threonine-protein phosphatase 7 long form homolog [Brachypodium distachyon]|uniref:serine/threonine-protein phosphatase 7 long form homolog n=1 Tax=Brachypodium distachyon TaxID=15368 RepID=UPI000D0C98F6|nr:serine/threonine-protein phosphatase 7 long form homolog [Brachypodium distachyon]|eukprot:XP_024318336.1 serine/threonine-protein phosphatase 7 long form homolog [Brachypodium distachyon]
MFTENHVTTISARYIPIAVEIANATCGDDITKRSWGSAVLAATYRGMCNACQLASPKSALLGCPLLLQLWSWERFSIGRLDVTGDHANPKQELFDLEHIDLPTFATIWTCNKRRFAHDQVRSCFPSFNEQFDVLHSEAVVWEPYTQHAIDVRYPGGMSMVCMRDYTYWMTKSKIIFDVCVEEMAQQRVMRQFGARQLVVPLPTKDPLPPIVHMYVQFYNL